jgi:transposase-like protein
MATKKAAAKAAKKVTNKRGIWSPEEKARAVARLVAGEKMADLSKEYAVSESAIYLWKKKFGGTDTLEDILKKKPTYLRTTHDGDTFKFLPENSSSLRERLDALEPAEVAKKLPEVTEYTKEVDVFGDKDQYIVGILKNGECIFISESKYAPILHHDFEMGTAQLNWDLE